ncbi:Basic-leucine zipper domain containing protein, partial [Globisporangium splendens]
MSHNNSNNQSRRGETNGFADEHAHIEPIPFAYPGRSSATGALDELFVPGANAAPLREELITTMVSAQTQALRGQSTNSGASRNLNAAKRPRSSTPSPSSSSERGEHGAACTSKEEMRKLKNRVSAAKSRQRAQDHIRSLEHTVDALQRRNAFLRNEVQRLMTEQQHRQAQSSIHHATSGGSSHNGRWMTR